MNPQIIVALIIALVAVIAMFIGFFKLPTEKKISNLKQWLKYAVVEAEKALGSGTGQLKLRYVYDKAVEQFPWIVALISFDTFSDWVDEALEWMRAELETNKNINDYVKA
jgi:hypothetical protein